MDRLPTLASPAVVNSDQQPALRPTMRRRLISRLLVLATIASILSTAGFLGYLLLPLFIHFPRSDLAGLYTVGVAGLGVAEACQIIGVVLLLSLWITRTYAPRKLREVVILLLSLIPYVPVVIFIITIYVYLRVRRQHPLSPRRRQAAQDVREQTLDTLIDAASEASSSSASGAAPTQSPATSALQPAVSGQPGSSLPLARPAPRSPGAVRTRARAQEAIRRVIGPSTSQVISGAANSLAAVAMAGLLLATIATAATGIAVGVVLPPSSLSSLLLPPSPTPSATTPARGVCSSPPRVDPQASTIIGAVRHTTEFTDWQTGSLAPQNDLATFPLKQPFTTAVLLRTNSAGTLAVKMTFCSDGHDDPTIDDYSSQVPSGLAGTWYVATNWFYDARGSQDVGRVMQSVLWDGSLVHVSFLTIASTNTPYPCPAPVVTPANDFTLSGVHVVAAQVSETGVAYLQFAYAAQRSGTIEFFVCIDGDTFLSSSQQIPGGTAGPYQAYQDMIQDPGGGYCLTCQEYGAARWMVVWDHQLVAQVPFDVTP